MGERGRGGEGEVLTLKLLLRDLGGAAGRVEVVPKATSDGGADVNGGFASRHGDECCVGVLVGVVWCGLSKKCRWNEMRGGQLGTETRSW
jgi:hypothetical protein